MTAVDWPLVTAETKEGFISDYIKCEFNKWRAICWAAWRSDCGL